jgi:chemotaxis protein CheX
VKRGRNEPPSLDDGDYMDIVMINALLASLFTIFSTMVRLKIQPGDPLLKEHNIAKGEISALIGMNAEGVQGSVALSLSLPAIRLISKSMMDYEITSISDEASNLAGELVNMLVGGAKRILSEKGYDFDMQTPQLLRGDGHEITHHHSGRTVLLPIKTGEEEFYIELNFA